VSDPSRDGRRLADDPIAIVGVSCLFPMARDYREYWQNIIDGADCTSQVPQSRWSTADYYDPDPAVPDKSYSRRGGFIPDVEFSPVEFGIPPNQLEVTSTMQTLSLGVARDLLRDAGATGSQWYDPARTGVVLGVAGPVPLMHPLAARLSTPVLKEVVRAAGLTESDARQIADRYVRAFAPWEENSFPGLLANVVAGRIANRLDLGGLNSTVDAACAASLSAVRMAIAELTDRRADTMIAGGADTENSIFGYLSFAKVGALSRTDKISPLSDEADGTLIGEGIGMLALRRLADAERDGNRIYAVIRGLGSSSDGRANSIYAPRLEGQQVALRRAYDDAACSPASVELFEAHATGTAVGDRTELNALNELLSEHSDEPHFAALGSVKSQIGHTKGAAGTASLIKLALSLYHKTLPPTINVVRPNSNVDFSAAPFYLNVATRPWIRDPHRPARRAAVSAMGFGGTNFHVVLQEHDARRSAVRNLHRAATAHVWHAPDPAALAELLRSGALSADGGTGPSGDTVPAGHARVGLVAHAANLAELRALAAARIAEHPDAESWSLPKGVHYRRQAASGLRIGGLFAGQGSQYLNMGLEAALNIPTVGEAFDDANAVFAGHDPRLSAVVFPPPVFTPEVRQAQEALLRQTQYAQPAIGALSAGQFRFLRELGLDCVSYAGHSFGELGALWAAGSLTDADYFRLAAARGAAMAPSSGTADPGSMAAITAGRDQVDEILARAPGDAVVCNHNAPDQVVVGGSTAAIDALISACAASKITARKLPVSAAFHTSYVAHAQESFREAIDAIEVAPPTAPVHANSPGASYGPDPAANAETLGAQLLRPVEFVDVVRAMHAEGVTVFVEFGPKQVLTGLVRRILGDDVTAIATDAGPLGDADVALKQAAVQLVVLGAPLTGINRYDAPVTAATAPKGMTVTLSAPEYVPAARSAAYAAGLSDGFLVSLPAGQNGNGNGNGHHAIGHVPPAGGPARTAGPAAPAPATGTATATAGQAAPAVSAAPAAPATVGPAGDGTAGQAVSHPTEAHYPEERFPMTAQPAAALPTRDDPAAQHLALHARYLESQLHVAEALLGLVAEHGLDHPQLPQIAETVAEQSVAIGGAHARAAEVLARLTELELGADPAAFASADLRRRRAPAAYTATAVAPAAAPELPAGRFAIDAGPQQAAPAATVDAPSWAATAPAPAPEAPSAPVAPPPPAVEAPAPADPVPGAQAGPDPEALRAALIAIVAEKTGYPPDLIDPGMDLEADLGIDSIKRVQVIGSVQEQFAGLPTVGPEQLSELRSLDQVVGFMVAGAGDADPKALSPAAEPEAAGGPAHAPRYLIELTGVPAIDLLDAPYPADPVAVLCHHGGADAAATAAALGAHGWTVRQVCLPAGHEQADGPGEHADTVGEAAIAAALAGQVNAVITLATDVAAQDWADAARRLADAVMIARHAQAALTPVVSSPVVSSPVVSSPPAGQYRAAFVTVTRLDGELGLAGTAEPPTALLGGVAGVVKTLAIEAPQLFCRALDIHQGLSADDAAAVLLDELRDAATDTIEIGVDTARQRRTIVPGRYHRAGGNDTGSANTGPANTGPAADGPAPLPAPDVRPDDIFVVTGGGRGITALCVTELAARSGQPAQYLLLGRTELVPEPEWAAGVADGDLKAAVIAAARSEGKRIVPREIDQRYSRLAAQREIRGTLGKLAATGATAHYLAVDVADPAAVREALAGRPVTGVIHGAGVLADAFLADKTREQAERVLLPKLGGLAAVLAAIDPGRLRHLVLFTSVAGLLGNAGQADYAAANEALCRFAASWQRRHPGQHVVAIDWGAWDAGMVTPSLRAALSERGVPLLDPAAGARAFADQFTAPLLGQRRVLIGARKALSDRTETARTEIGGAGTARTARRSLAGLEDDEVITAHQIGAHKVLPATFGLGWMINVAERAYPANLVVRVRDFQVYRGIVFDGSQASEYVTELGAAERSGGRLIVRAAVRAAASGGLPAPHYGATLELAAAPEPGGRRPAPVPGSGAGDALTLYTSAVCFHAPRLQGMRDILEFTGDRLAVRCRLADAAVARGAFSGALHSPVLADILLQGASVLGGRIRERSLPLAIATADYHAPLPDDEDFYVVLDQLRSAGAGVSVNATATDAAGRDLVRLTGITLVPAPGMHAKFAEAVGRWSKELELT
jgi:acyl transferase domain-containing protein